MSVMVSRWLCKLVVFRHSSNNKFLFFFFNCVRGVHGGSTSSGATLRCDIVHRLAHLIIPFIS